MTESDPTTTGTARYHITGQTETTQVTPAGQVQDVIQVMFGTDDGLQGSVNVPVAAYNVATVRAAVLAKLATMQAVAALTQ